MKTFKEYYIKYIKESPENTGPLGFENKTDNELGVVDIINSEQFEKVYQFKDIGIFLYENIDGNDIMIHFVNESGGSVGYVNYEEVENGGVKISSVMNRSGIKGLVYLVYTEFLLGKYNFIVSDGKHSPDAKKFWNTLITSLISSKFIYVCNDKLEILKRIDSMNELNSYYGDDESYEKYLFMISNEQF